MHPTHNLAGVVAGLTHALIAGFVASATLHGLYDLLLARPALLPAAGAVLVLGVRGWLLWTTPKLAALGRHST